MFKEKHFTGLIYIIPMVFIILTASIITFIHIEKANSKFETDYNKLKEDFLDKEEQRIFTIVESVNSYIKFKKASSLNVIKDNVKSKIDFANRILNRLYNQDKLLQSSIQIELLKSLSQIKSNDNGKYFVYTYKDNTKFLELSYDRDLGDPIYTNKDYLKKFNGLMKKKSEGFILYTSNESNSSTEDNFRVSYIKDFPKLNIVVGYSIDLKEYISIAKNEVKKRLDLMSINDNGYIFTLDNDLRILQHSRKDTYTNRSFLLYEKNKEVIESISEFIKKSKVGLSNEKYKFIWKKIDNNSYKLYILNYVKHWDWLISVAVNIDNINENIEKIIGVDKQKTEQSIKETIKIVLIFLIIALIISYFVSLKLNQLFNRHKLRIENQKNALKNINATLEFKVEEKTKELEELNDKLKNRFKEEVKKNRKKDQLLYSQSKMASMGEMIGNIAHQWRQPLSTISTIASGNSLKMEFDILEKNDLKKDFSKIVDTTKHLSDTIEDFRNFFNENKTIEEFDLTDLLEKNLSLISASMKNSYITIVENYNSVRIKAIKNELLQATLNILNNARDALLDIDEAKRFIVIDIYSDDTYAYISIKDSAGGIPDNIKDDIFKAHFTTKGEKSGTGIGLYMTKQIVEKHSNGILTVENEEFVLEEQVYKGANFKISLPL
ncbi:sensor histidine kinase [Arcobacter roscoffensis]|uniref:histidine kinase n=1 Tax=Arcobacter roscoffensis TaxID=2961520 RepID=A0ABY5E175_9BACT|nr:cache domain-containing protein [Arcobacter roscoffensis]UTJ05954.1 cache domain-containing protein [Arcobacter roscoffensis]